MIIHGCYYRHFCILSLLSMEVFINFQDIVTSIEYNYKPCGKKPAIRFAVALPKVSEGLHFLLVRAVEQLPKGAQASTFATPGKSPMCQLSYCWRYFGAETQDCELRHGRQEHPWVRRASNREMRRGNTVGCASTHLPAPKKETILAAELDERNQYRFEVQFG